MNRTSKDWFPFRLPEVCPCGVNFPLLILRRFHRNVFDLYREIAGAVGVHFHPEFLSRNGDLKGFGISEEAGERSRRLFFRSQCRQHGNSQRFSERVAELRLLHFQFVCHVIFRIVVETAGGYFGKQFVRCFESRRERAWRWPPDV